LKDQRLDEYLYVRIRTADALAKIGTPEAISGLITALQDKDWTVRRSAASALGEIKASTPEVNSGLLTALKDEERDVRRIAADALAKIGTPEAISGLITALQDKDWTVRRSPASALGGIKASTPEVIIGSLTSFYGESKRSKESVRSFL
jgi:HEAT repeat protein